MTETTPAPWSDEAQDDNIKKANEYLRMIAGGRVTHQEAFEYRTDKSGRIALPSTPKKMPLDKAALILAQQAEAEQATYEFYQKFDCRPPDGAIAFNAILKKVYGVTAVGRGIESMFFSKPPEIKSVKTGLKESVQYPWGLVEFAPLEAQFMLDMVQDDDYGMAFLIRGLAKKKYEAEISGLFEEIAQYVQEHGIYRGKALLGVGKAFGDQFKEPEFYNPYSVDRTKVVYSTDVYEALVDEIWGVVKYADLLREAEIDIGNKVLLHGENGTGKTLAAAITAQFCLEHSWSFIQARWDEDLRHVLRFAELLGTPSVVVIEDVEKLIKQNAQAMDSLLEQFDGMRTKGREVLLLMTSNHAEELPQKLTRAGRINRMIYVSDLDEEAVEKLIKRLIPEEQREELDYAALHTAYEGYAPSWIVQALNGVSKRSIIRTGQLGQPLATPDFVRCADALRPAWKLHIEKDDRPKVIDLEQAQRRVVREELQAHYVDLSDGEILVRD